MIFLPKLLKTEANDLCQKKVNAFATQREIVLMSVVTPRGPLRS